VVCVLEHVEQIDHPVAPLDLRVQRGQVRRVRQSVKRRHEDPRFAVLGPDPHATRAAAPDRVVQPAERGLQALLEIGDNTAGSNGLWIGA
jgi:hypothetical protein